MQVYLLVLISLFFSFLLSLSLSLSLFPSPLSLCLEEFLCNANLYISIASMKFNHNVHC